MLLKLLRSLVYKKTTFLLILFTLFNAQTSLAADPNILVILEEPVANNVSTGISNLRGWAIGLAPISKIELFIDGQYSTDIPSGAARADVGAAFPNYPNANRSGFSMAFPYTLLSPGSHTALIRAHDINGLTQETSSSFIVARLDNEFIADPNLVSLSSATASLSGQEVIVTNLIADGRFYDVRLRWRVATQQFEMESVIKRGVSSLTASTISALSGVQPAASVAHVETSPLIITLEEPSAQFTSNGIANLRGWAVGQATIQKIELFIDGQYSTDIPAGATRNDVRDAFPQYPNSAQSGFSMAFPYSELSKGNHTVLVRAHDVNGFTQDASASFNVTRLENNFISDINTVNLDSASVQIENEQIVVSNFIADGIGYTLRLQWQTATQQFEIQNIITQGGSPTSNLSRADAARFLTQSTFGPTITTIDSLVSLGGYKKWLTQQFSAPISSRQLPATEALWLKSCPKKDGVVYNNRPTSGALDLNAELFRINAWWEMTINGSDQLRQRIALALSEIFVVSAVGLSRNSFGLADYYDMLAENAFGNYRTLLEKVTLHPMMGLYLNMLQSKKSSRPDENYARELLQLFSIGLFELNLDGSTKLSNGAPIPSYNQDIIKGFAKVFTGWNFANANIWRLNRKEGDTTTLMTPWAEFHDATNEKPLLNGTILPAGQTATQDLRNALDNVFNHPNVGPFISKQLIQRLITSNPSAAYVQRVAQVFNNNGAGTRGDLKAVIQTILLDPEARDGHLTIPHYGKLREPMLRLSHLRRAFNVLPATREGTCNRGLYSLYHRMFISTVGSQFFGQEILRSPSVFNFFLPDYTPSGPIKNANLVAPEFQLITGDATVNLTNEISAEIHRTDKANTFTTLQLAREVALAADPNALLDHLDLLLLSGKMSTAMRGILLDHLNNSTFPDGNEGLEAKAKDIITLIVSSPDHIIQK